MDLVSELKGDLCIVTNALRKIKEDNDNNNNHGSNNGPTLEHSVEGSQFAISLQASSNSQQFQVMLPNEARHTNVSDQQTPTESESVLIEEMISAVKDIQFHNQAQTET